MTPPENTIDTMTPQTTTQPCAKDMAVEINSGRLLGEQGHLRIAHRGSVYILRATSKGGLILTK